MKLNLRILATQNHDGKHQTVLQINFIWLGPDELRPLDKFNVYSWRALGHAVTIYAYKFRGTHDLESLGLIQDTANVVDLPTLIAGDKQTMQSGSAEKDYLDILTNTKNMRYVMNAWYTAVPLVLPPTIDHIYNMADITKSYIAGTRRGLVLDLKIGPSENIRACESAGMFDNFFISYKRGESTFGNLPENQCMGTMQKTHEMRGIYVKRFEQLLSNFDGHIQRASKPNDKHFDNLTSYHGRSWAEVQKKKKSALDVTLPKELFSRLGLFGMNVEEIADEVNYGPFRVFKLRADQTNTSLASTSVQQQIDLCGYASNQQIMRRLVVNQEFHKERVKVGVGWKTAQYFL